MKSIVVGLATLLIGVTVSAQEWPSRPLRLNAELARFSASADTQRTWGAQGATPMTMGVDEFARYVDADIAKWAKVVKFSGAKEE